MEIGRLSCEANVLEKKQMAADARSIEDCAIEVDGKGSRLKSEGDSQSASGRRSDGLLQVSMRTNVRSGKIIGFTPDDWIEEGEGKKKAS